MTGKALDYSTLFNRSLPAPPAPFAGHPRYNFIGGHSDPDMVPMEGFIESAGRVFRGDPRNISMYNFDGGPQGITPLRQFLVDKLAAHRGINTTIDEILITSGSGPGHRADQRDPAGGGRYRHRRSVQLLRRPGQHPAPQGQHGGHRRRPRRPAHGPAGPGP